MQSKREDASKELDASRKKQEALSAESKRLSSTVAELTEHLKSALNSPNAGLETLQQIQEIEARGNMWIDLRSGETKIKKPIVFEPRKGGDELTAAFLDPEIADAVLIDIVEL